MNTENFKKDFLARLGDASPFEHLLDLLPDVAFFIKDRRGRFVLNNRRATEPTAGIRRMPRLIRKRLGTVFSTARKSFACGKRAVNGRSQYLLDRSLRQPPW